MLKQQRRSTEVLNSGAARTPSRAATQFSELSSIGCGCYVMCNTHYPSWKLSRWQRGAVVKNVGIRPKN